MARAVLPSGSMRCVTFMVLAVVTACGGAKPGPTAPEAPSGRDAPPSGPTLEPQIGDLQWYRAVSTCGQGPYEVEVPITGNKWGEELELRVATPRKIALRAVILVDGRELATTNTVIDRDGTTSGPPDNTKCVADARERLVLGRPGGPVTPHGPIVPGRRVPDVPPVPEAPAAQLEHVDEPHYAAPSTLIRVRLDTTVPPSARVRIRFWSIEPNDLTDVRFGAVRIAWRPNIGEAEYAAYLVRLEREDAERRARMAAEAEARRRRYLEIEEARRRQQRTAPPPDPEAERRLRERLERERLAEEQARERRDREAYERAERARLRAEEAARRRAVELALAAERARRRAAWCAAHRESRDCWGAGGYKVHAELNQRGKERETYCAANRDDARCWSAGERKRRTKIWDARVIAARTPPKPPEGPPPAALADPQPPRLSENAEWRPGYWFWLDGHWVWLAGQWRVPPEDIEQERTTKAPSAPPPPKVETIAVAPAPRVVWVSGYWMWNSTQWIWIPGSWQIRPSATVRWREPEWRVRGAVHVLIPGGWVR